MQFIDHSCGSSNSSIKSGYLCKETSADYKRENSITKSLFPSKAPADSVSWELADHSDHQAHAVSHTWPAPTSACCHRPADRHPLSIPLLSEALGWTPGLSALSPAWGPCCLCAPWAQLEHSWSWVWLPLPMPSSLSTLAWMCGATADLLCQLLLNPRGRARKGGRVAFCPTLGNGLLAMTRPTGPYRLPDHISEYTREYSGREFQPQPATACQVLAHLQCTDHSSGARGEGQRQMGWFLR